MLSYKSVFKHKLKFQNRIFLIVISSDVEVKILNTGHRVFRPEIKKKKKSQFCELGWNSAQCESGRMKNTIQQVIEEDFGSKCYLKIQGDFMN